MPEIKAIYPVQCSCGHLFLEKYQFSELTKEGNIGFCWCGFCKTKFMVKPYKNEDRHEQQVTSGSPSCS